MVEERRGSSPHRLHLEGAQEWSAADGSADREPGRLESDRGAATQTLRNRMVSDGTRLYFAGVSNATAPGSWAAAGTGFGADGFFSIAVNPSPAQSFTQICANTGPSDATGWYLSPDGASLFSNCGANGPIAVASGNVYTTGQFLLSFPAAGSLAPTSPVNMFAPTFRFDAGLFVVVIVRGPTASFEDYSLRVYLCSDPT